tara:strand:+ start:108 stop:452 length:345 start_codon:yes stop_codon:yes gene_type:complete
MMFVDYEKRIRQNRLENLYTVSYFDGDKCERVVLQFQTEDELEFSDIFSPFNSDYRVMDERTLSEYVTEHSPKTLREVLFGKDSVRIFDNVMNQLSDQLKKEEEIFKENVEKIV